jgi:tRNA(Ile2) C34 agmatinyltransferase TiaS
MSDCKCSSLKKAVCNASLYGMLKAASMDVVKKAPKKDKDIITEKVSKGKWKSELLGSVVAYGGAQMMYGYTDMGTMFYGYEPEAVKGLPIDVAADVYKAAIIELVNYFMGRGSISGFLHELLLVGGADVVYNSVSKM